MKRKRGEKGGIVVGSKRVVPRALRRGEVLDPAVSVPVVTAGRSSALRVVRRADLLPASIPKAFHGLVALGDVMVDVFLPLYGFWAPRLDPLFEFQYSRVSFTAPSGWYFRREAGDPIPQSLKFRILPEALAAYMRVEFGQNADNAAPRCSMTVRIDGHSFQVDIAARSFSFLDVVLQGEGAVGHEVEFSIDSVPSGQPHVIASIARIDLYQSVRAFPSGALGP